MVISPELFTEVFVARVRQDHYNQALLQLAGNFKGGCHGCAGGDAYKQALLAGQPAGDGLSLLGGDPQGMGSARAGS